MIKRLLVKTMVDIKAGSRSFYVKIKERNALYFLRVPLYSNVFIGHYSEIERMEHEKDRFRYLITVQNDKYYKNTSNIEEKPFYLKHYEESIIYFGGIKIFFFSNRGTTIE
jgi:hypothetical protein